MIKLGNYVGTTLLVYILCLFLFQDVNANIENNIIKKGFDSNKWHLITIPCISDNMTVGNIFNGLEEKKWALFSYNGKSYTSLSNNDTLTLGKGYWFKYTSGNYVEASVTCDTEKPFTTLLPSKKWSLLGNPYGKDLYLDMINADDSPFINKIEEKKVRPIYVYRDNKYKILRKTEHSIDAWEGFWVRNNDLEDTELSFLGAVEEAIDLPLPISKLLDEKEISSLYTEFTGYTSQDTYFGVYPMVEVNDSKIYLGIGSGLPAGSDGAALASYDIVTGNFEYKDTFDEQGIMSFTKVGNDIVSPGVDPCCASVLNNQGEQGRYNNEWDWGNLYIINSENDEVLKKRNLDNIFHGWGSWYNNETKNLYYAASGHFADTENIDEVTQSGLIYYTNDKGEEWTRLADFNNGIGNYRTYDIIGYDNDTLFAQWSDLDGNCGISKTIDSGQTWNRIEGLHVRCATRLHILGNKLVVLSEDRTSFTLIDIDTSIVTKKSFQGEFTHTSYHTFTQDPYGNIYIGTNDGRVMHTRDFDTWTELAKNVDSSALSFNSIFYWEGQEAIVLSNWGENANLWKIDLKNSDKEGLPDVLE